MGAWLFGGGGLGHSSLIVEEESRTICISMSIDLLNAMLKIVCNEWKGGVAERRKRYMKKGTYGTYLRTT
jgi:hypothetical protein